MNSFPVLGVTGLPCSGKSRAAQHLAGGLVFGVKGVLLKADDIGHAVLEQPEIVEAIRARFGSAVAGADDAAAMRKAVASVVFRDPEELAWLEALTHPPILRETKEIVQRIGGRQPVVVEAALLIVGGLAELCDWVVLVEARLDIRIVRAAGRGWPPDELARRERRLLPLFTPKALAPIEKKIIHVRNDTDDNRLDKRLEAALWKIAVQ